MRLELDARARRLLRLLPGRNVYSALELLLLVALAAQCARLVWAIATPVGPLGDWRPVRATSGAPTSILRGFDPFFRISGAGSGPAVVTSLQMTLFGTRLNEASGGGSAIIAGPDGIQQSVAVGAEIIPGVTLKSVAFDHVTIDRGGTAEDLFLDQSGAVQSVAPPVAGPNGAAPTGVSMGGPPPPPPPGPPPLTLTQLRSDVGFIPRIDGGKVSGLVVRPQGSGGGFRRANLREGDVVTAINGRAVTGQADLDRVAGALAKGGNLSVTVERGNETLPLVITIAGQ